MRPDNCAAHIHTRGSFYIVTLELLFAASKCRQLAGSALVHLHGPFAKLVFCSKLASSSSGVLVLDFIMLGCIDINGNVQYSLSRLLGWLLERRVWDTLTRAYNIHNCVSE
jgi:hypothetical protein